MLSGVFVCLVSMLDVLWQNTPYCFALAVRFVVKKFCVGGIARIAGLPVMRPPGLVLVHRCRGVEACNSFSSNPTNPASRGVQLLLLRTSCSCHYQCSWVITFLRSLPADSASILSAFLALWSAHGSSQWRQRWQPFPAALFLEQL